MPYLVFDTRPRPNPNPVTRQQKLVASVVSNKLMIRGLIDIAEATKDEVVFKTPSSIMTPYPYVALERSRENKPLIQFLLRPLKKPSHRFYRKYRDQYFRIWNWLEFRRNELRPTSYR